MCFQFFLKRGRGLQIDLRAGEPPPSRQCLPCPVSEARVRVSRLHLPETQVLGQKCGGGAQRHHDAGATEVSVCVHLRAEFVLMKFVVGEAEFDSFDYLFVILCLHMSI